MASIINAKMFLPGIFFTIAAGLGAAFMLLKRVNQQVSLKVFMIYSIIAILAYCLAGLVGFFSFENAMLLFVLCQFLFLFLGILHFSFVSRLIKTSVDQDNFFQEFLFTLYIACLGIFAFQFIFSFTDNGHYGLLFSAAQLMFVIPFLLLTTAQYAVDIPQKIYEKWYYPTDPSKMEVSDDVWESGNPLMLNFETTRSLDNPEVSILRGKAPPSMEFGLFFANWIEAWNESNPGGKVRVFDEVGVPYAWNFYIQKKGIFGTRDYIDPSLSIRENGLSEQDRIIAERV